MLGGGRGMDIRPRRKWSQKGRGDITLVQLKTKVSSHTLSKNPWQS